MRALGDAYEPLVERYGTEFALEERERFISDRRIDGGCL